MSSKEVALVPKVLTSEEKKQDLGKGVYYLLDKEDFIGGILQELTVKDASHYPEIPTAACSYNKKTQAFEILINYNFFHKLTTPQKAAVLHHEILHFTNKHLFRLPFLSESVSNREKMIYNIAGDMAINQYIKNLPEGAINVKEWKTDNGGNFPEERTMEYYYDLIKEELKKEEEDNGGKDEKGNTLPRIGKGNVPEKVGTTVEFDKHFWESLTDEEKQQMLNEAKNVLKRTIEKTQYTHSTIPGHIQDLLNEIDTLSSKMNYKQILKNIIKKTVSCVDREATWKKPNKRYGYQSPGSKLGALPQLTMYIDTSGSISITEMNMFLTIVSNFLKVGVRTCDLALWHTEMYYKKKYRLHAELDKSALQSGGTSINCVLENIRKSNPNLSVILTDGYYEPSSIKPKTEVVWIISKQGNQNHPHKNIGKTILLDKLE